MKHAIVETNEAPHISSGFPSLRLPALTFQAVRESVFSALAKNFATPAADIAAVAISTKGSVDPTGRVLRAGLFRDYAGVDWAALISDRFPHVPKVLTVNDGRASTWAEYRRHGEHVASFAHFVVGTGVGGGIVLAHRLMPGAHGAAGGLGHIKVQPDSTVRCSCTRTGCVETLASAPAVVRRFHQLRLGAGADVGDGPGRHAGSGRAAAGEGTLGDEIIRGGEITLDDVVRAARDGDEPALRAFRDAGRWLGAAISDVMNVLDPDAITIGGGLLQAASVAAAGGAHESYLAAAERAARDLAVARIADRTVIAPAAYGNDGGLIGAALLASTGP
ncbi:ROK family protein [Frankia sp. QA3]|uniref:ROK family protein n=1 Tax=Frankia sp. QA3 TaxID=710111 RepID=UPI0012F7877F|nr:ROK family protein [Frankia sp. QA3]